MQTVIEFVSNLSFAVVKLGALRDKAYLDRYGGKQVGQKAL